jgi:CRP/FNR family transcriptional activator FtrB
VRPAEKPEIAHLPLFREMQEEQRERVSSGSFLQVFPPQLTLFELGQHPDFLHVLVDGLVELYATSAGVTRRCGSSSRLPVSFWPPW